MHFSWYEWLFVFQCVVEVSEWASDCCLTQTEPYHVTYRYSDADVRFNLYPTNTNSYYSIVLARSLKKYFAGRHVTPFSGELSKIGFNKFLFLLLNAVFLVEKQQMSILLSLDWIKLGSNSQSTTLKTKTLTITPPVLFWRR